MWVTAQMAQMVQEGGPTHQLFTEATSVSLSGNTEAVFSHLQEGLCKQRYLLSRKEEGDALAPRYLTVPIEPSGFWAGPALSFLVWAGLLGGSQGYSPRNLTQCSDGATA